MKKNDSFAIPHPQYEETPAALHNIRQSRDEEGCIRLRKVDSDYYLMDGRDLFDAFNILISDEFDNMLIAYENKNQYYDEMTAAYNKAYASLDHNTLYDAVHTAKYYGRWNGLFHERQQQLIANTSYGAFYDACMLYEALFGIDHVELV